MTTEYMENTCLRGAYIMLQQMANPIENYHRQQTGRYHHHYHHRPQEGRWKDPRRLKCRERTLGPGKASKPK